MRFLLIILFIAAAGCSSPDGDPPVADSDSSVENAPESASLMTYECESGRVIQASYPTNDTAVVEYEGQTLQMTIAVSGSGARYVGDGLEWWTKAAGPGSEGTLFRHNGDGTSGEIVEQCEQPT